MAERTLTEPAYVARLAAALHQALPDAEIGHEQVRGERYRFFVVSERFKDMGHPERQRIVWDIADNVLQKPDLLNVAMIMTIAHSDYPDTTIII
jgi:acid stress-induced BolA-like protein IbaG/YrbA